MCDAFDALRSRGIVVAAAGRDAEWADRSARRDVGGVLSGIRFFPTLRLAELAYHADLPGTQTGGHSAS